MALAKFIKISIRSTKFVGLIEPFHNTVIIRRYFL